MLACSQVLDEMEDELDEISGKKCGVLERLRARLKGEAGGEAEGGRERKSEGGSMVWRRRRVPVPSAGIS